MKNWMLDLVSDGNGSASTMRVATLLIVIAVLVNWIYLTVHTGQQQPLDWQEVGLVVGSLAAKAAQVKLESNSGSVAPPPPAPKPGP